MIPVAAHPHDQFYFTDGSLKLQVENTLYFVHRYLFTTYACGFMPTLSDYALRNGTYLLDDVKQVDFDRLLSCLYPRELLAEESRSSEEWISILKLASKWEFESLRMRAISELESIANPIEKVVLGREYDIPELRLPAYVDLCKSIVPLTEEDGERLGLKDVIKIYRVRQELWGQDINPASSEDILEKVRTNFLPLQPLPPHPAHNNYESPIPRIPQIPRLPSPPTPRRPHSPQFLASLLDFPKRAKEEEWIIADPGRSSQEEVERKRTPSPPTSVEDPVTPPPLAQLQRTVLVVPPTKAAEQIVPTIPMTMVPSAQGPSPSPSKPKKQKPPPNPPGTGKKGKKKAALLLASAAEVAVAQPSW